MEKNEEDEEKEEGKGEDGGGSRRNRRCSHAYTQTDAHAEAHTHIHACTRQIAFFPTPGVRAATFCWSPPAMRESPCLHVEADYEAGIVISPLDCYLPASFCLLTAHS